MRHHKSQVQEGQVDKDSNDMDGNESFHSSPSCLSSTKSAFGNFGCKKTKQNRNNCIEKVHFAFTVN